MPSTLFTDVLLSVSRSRRALKDHRRRTFEWYRRNAAEVRKVARSIDKETADPRKIMLTGGQALSKRKVFAKNMVGKLVHFYYDPKGKETLPYYDTFPLIFPIDMMADGRMLGINLHYLNPTMRAVLMNKLYGLLEDEPDGAKRLGLSYGILKAASQYKYFRPCLKSYLISHVRSRFLTVDPKEWDAAITLPTAQFQKASEAKVWQDSLDKIKNS